MKERKIEFEKWIDPFLPVGEDNPSPDEEFLKSKFHDEDIKLSPYKGYFLFGPLGLMPLNEANLPSRRFNMWVAHTNFNVSPHVLSILNKLDGVDIVRPLTRYCFWLGIGHCFETEEVHERIRETFCGPSRSKRLREAIELVRATREYWAVLSDNNTGQFEVLIGKDEASLRKKLELKGDDKKIEATSLD